MLSENQLKSKLDNLHSVHAGTIKSCVIDEALEYCSIKEFFSDLQTHGCRSGIVSSLIYYSDTHEFFDNHYDEIESIREEVEFELGEPLRLHGDLKNELAWIAFEHEAYHLADDLGLT